MTNIKNINHVHQRRKIFHQQVNMYIFDMSAPARSQYNFLKMDTHQIIYESHGRNNNITGLFRFYALKLEQTFWSILQHSWKWKVHLNIQMFPRHSNISNHGVTGLNLNSILLTIFICGLILIYLLMALCVITWMGTIGFWLILVFCWSVDIYMENRNWITLVAISLLVSHLFSAF